MGVQFGSPGKVRAWGEIFTVESDRPYLIDILLGLLKVLGVMGLFSVVKCEKGRNACLCAISFNDWYISCMNQPAGKILHVRISGKL